MGKLTKPLTLFVSVGDGNIISGIHKGFKDLVELGLVGPDAAHHWCSS